MSIPHIHNTQNSQATNTVIMDGFTFTFDFTFTFNFDDP